MNITEKSYLEEINKEDKSFTEKGNMLGGLFGSSSYSQEEVRKIWFQAKSVGFEHGLHFSSPEGRRVQLNHNCTEPKQKEFLDKFYALANEYNMCINYHPLEGMTIKELHSKSI